MRTLSDFRFPGRLISSRGASGELGPVLDGLGSSGHVFLVADPVVRSLGLLDGIVAGLEAGGRDVTIFDGIDREPTSVDVQSGIELAKQVEATVFVGVGGGSALDSTKMIALGTRLSVQIGDVTGQQMPVAGFPTLVLIPTTTGTGSEATRIAMYTHAGHKRAIASAQFVPDVAVLDADLVDGLPPAILAATALDALSHAIESMMSTTSNSLTELIAGEAARLIFTHLLEAQSPDAAASRETLLYASFLGGVALNAGVVLGHSLSYVLAAHYGLSHGGGCALALPYCIAYNGAMDDTRGGEIARRVLGDPRATLQDLAHASRRLAADAGLPTALGDLPLPGADPATMARELVTDYPRPTNPVTLDADRLTSLIAAMETGDLDRAWKAMNP